MKKRLIFYILVISLSFSCTQREKDNQGHTEACWIYAMLTCIEKEQLRKGDSVALSRQWLMSNLMQEECRERYLTGGDRVITMRGVGPDVLRLIQHYGLVPYMHEKTVVNNSKVLERKLTRLTDRARSMEELQEEVRPFLPSFTVARSSNSFYYMGMRYTPMQFAESIMYDQQWRWYASVAYHPWGERFALEVKDNRRYHEYENQPMDSIVKMVMASLKKGHPVYWELGWNESTQPQGGGASSDHAMAIVGTTKNKNGERYFVCLNSYGAKWGNAGRCRVSLDYFRKHTCNVGVLDDNVR